MKKIFTIVIILVALITNAQVPSYVPTNGLVGYWPFNGNANDVSGNGNNGTLNGATLTTDRFGNNNSAFNFDGLSNNIVVADNALLRPSQITLSCWINSDLTKPSQNILSKTNFSNAQGEQYGISVVNSGSISFGIKRNSNCSGGVGWKSLYTSTSIISPIIWSNIVCTYDGVTMKYYLNGNLVQTYTPPSSGSIDNCINGTFNIGKFWSGQPDYFKGKIDDVGIWNRALSQEEIKNLYNANQCITNITVTDTLIINVGQLSFNEPVTWANNITIFPNPASTQININFNNISDLNGGILKIINSLGQQVTTTPITTSGTKSTMQLATWGGSGVYFVQIVNSQGLIVDIKKIILQ